MDLCLCRSLRHELSIGKRLDIDDLLVRTDEDQVFVDPTNPTNDLDLYQKLTRNIVLR
jgi:hypothetical protein